MDGSAQITVARQRLHRRTKSRAQLSSRRASDASAHLRPNAQALAVRRIQRIVNDGIRLQLTQWPISHVYRLHLDCRRTISEKRRRRAGVIRPTYVVEFGFRFDRRGVSYNERWLPTLPDDLTLAERRTYQYTQHQFLQRVSAQFGLHLPALRFPPPHPFGGNGSYFLEAGGNATRAHRSAMDGVVVKTPPTQGRSRRRPDTRRDLIWNPPRSRRP